MEFLRLFVGAYRSEAERRISGESQGSLGLAQDVGQTVELPLWFIKDHCVGSQNLRGQRNGGQPLEAVHYLTFAVYLAAVLGAGMVAFERKDI